MKIVRFTWPHPSGGYGCDTSGEQAGPYVPLAEVEAMQDQIRLARDILSQSRHAFRSRQVERARKLLESALGEERQPEGR